MFTSIGPDAVGKIHPAEFDLLCAPKNPRISIRPAKVDDIDEIYRIIHRNVSFAVAPPDVMRFAQIVNEFRSRYLLTYTPSGVEPGGWHALDVRLKGTKGKIQARRGYLR